MDLGDFTNRGSNINIDIIPEFHEYRKEYAIHKAKLNNIDLDNNADDISSPDPIGVK